MIQPNSAPQPDRHSQSRQASLFAPQETISAEYYLKIGKSLYQSYLARSRQQDLEEAIHHFQKAVEMEPNLAEAYVQLASALWDQGAINLELAQFYCETALKLDPTQAEANLFLGYFLQRAGFYEDAVQQYQLSIHKSFYRSGRPRIALGHARLKQAVQSTNKVQQVTMALQGVGQFMLGCTLLPLDKQTCFLLKEALLTDAQIYTLNTVAKGLKSLKMNDMARRVYSLGIRMLPKEALFYHMLADDYLYEQDDPKEAVRYYQMAQALDPNNLGLLKKLGKAYAEAKDVSNAVTVLSSVVEKDADDYDSFYSLAQLYTDERAYFKALYYFKEACKIRPHSPYVHSNMAYVLFKLEDVEGAFEEYTIAMEYGTDPIWLSTVSQTLGTICYQLYNNPTGALEYLQHSLHYNPENQDTLVMLADLYFETGQMEMAISAYKTILQIDPENADCYSNIGYILWQMDRNDAAIDAYMTAIYYDKANHIAHNNLGVIYLDEDSNPTKAVPLFKKALDLKPDYTLACFNLGRALESLGNTLEAAEKYSTALELNQLNPELEDTEIQGHLDHLFS
jgi:tetratricopeptide (TPR) repeat protein